MDQPLPFSKGQETAGTRVFNALWHCSVRREARERLYSRMSGFLLVQRLPSGIFMTHIAWKHMFGVDGCCHCMQQDRFSSPAGLTLDLKSDCRQLHHCHLYGNNFSQREVDQASSEAEQPQQPALASGRNRQGPFDVLHCTFPQQQVPGSQATEPKHYTVRRQLQCRLGCLQKPYPQVVVYGFIRQ